MITSINSSHYSDLAQTTTGGTTATVAATGLAPRAVTMTVVLPGGTTTTGATMMTAVIPTVAMTGAGTTAGAMTEIPGAMMEIPGQEILGQGIPDRKTVGPLTGIAGPAK